MWIFPQTTESGRLLARMRSHVIVLFASLVASIACGAAEPAPRGLDSAPPPGANRHGAANLPTGDIRDFDFLMGRWSGKNRRLKVRGAGGAEWDEFPGVNRTRQYMGGMVNVGEIDFPTKGWSGVTVRAFNPATRQWSIYWISSKKGVLDPSQVGGFTGNRGEFYGEDVDDGRPVKVRYLWIKTGPDTAHWEQAFSYDGHTWETNWTAELVRTGPAGS
jgi:hypothetical protein